MKTVEEKIAACIDGKLTGDDLAAFKRELGCSESEFEEFIASESQSSVLQLGGLLRTHCSAPRLQNADFFNHQLMQRIEADAAAAGSGKEKGRGRMLFFSLPRMAWAGALCLLLALVVFAATIPGSRRSNPTTGQFISEILNAHTGDPAITASTFHSKSENVVVIWLDGLNYLADGEQL